MKSSVVTLKRTYQDTKFEGKEKRWVLISEDDVFFSYFGEWEEGRELTEGDRVKLSYTETQKGEKVFRNVKDWEIIERVHKPRPETKRKAEEEEKRKISKPKMRPKPPDYQLRLEALTKAIEIAKVTETDIDVLEMAKRIRLFLKGKESTEKEESEG